MDPDVRREQRVRPVHTVGTCRRTAARAPRSRSVRTILGRWYLAKEITNVVTGECRSGLRGVFGDRSGRSGVSRVDTTRKVLAAMAAQHPPPGQPGQWRRRWRPTITGKRRRPDCRRDDVDGTVQPAGMGPDSGRVERMRIRSEPGQCTTVQNDAGERQHEHHVYGPCGPAARQRHAFDHERE